MAFIFGPAIVAGAKLLVAESAIDSTVLTALIGTGGTVASGIIAKQSAEQAGRFALNSTIVKWVGGIILGSVLLYGGYKLFNSMADKGYAIDGSLDLEHLVARFRNEKVSKDEFKKIASDEKFTTGMKNTVSDYQKENHLSAKQIYDNLMQEFHEMDNFEDVPETDKKQYASKISGYIAKI